MKLILARVLPLAIALLVPSLAFAETPSAAKGKAKIHATHAAKRAKGGVKTPKPAKKAPKAHKPAKAPKASKKAKQ